MINKLSYLVALAAVHKYPEGENNHKELRRAFVEGAEWQQKESYFPDEVELTANEMVNWALDTISSPEDVPIDSGAKFDEILNKYKKYG